MSKDTTDAGQVAVLGIDLAKDVLQLHGVNNVGKVVLNKRLKRSKLSAFVARLQPCLIGIEACGGAHYWARVLFGLGHSVRMMAPQFVKPYVKSNKSDALDAQAICEAVQRPSMRFVPHKGVEQQDIQSLHRVRSQWVSRRTALANQIRGLLMEYGIVLPKGLGQVRKRLPLILEDAENGLSGLFRPLLADLYRELAHLDERVACIETRLEQVCHQREDCKRLLAIRGIGVLTATALVAAIGDIGVFKNARELAAWLGIVPRQYSTGGKCKLMGISKRGDTYLRTLLIHGGRAVVRLAHRYTDRFHRWVCELEQRRGKNIAAVAVANKNARIVWAVLTRPAPYELARA